MSHLRDVSSWPIHDAKRDYADGDLNRNVFDDYGMATPCTPEDDNFARVPIRVSHNEGSGITVEVGPYDFGEGEDFRRLEAAVAKARTYMERYTK